MVRKARGYLRGSTSSSMVPMTRLGTPARATMGTVARDSPEFTGPMTKCTFSLNTSCWARLTALVGSPAVSRVTSSSLRPSTPPAALISSTATSTPWFSAIAAEDSGPVSDDSQPMRIGSARAVPATSAMSDRHQRAARVPDIDRMFPPFAAYRPVPSGDRICFQFRLTVAALSRRGRALDKEHARR